MATLTFNGIELNYDPLSADLYIKENIKSFVTPLGTRTVQTLGKEARVLSCSGRYAPKESLRLYSQLRDVVGNTVSELSFDLDCFPARLTELMVTGDKEGFGRVLCYTFTEAL